MRPDLFDAWYQEWGARIRNQARRIARGDTDFADDLEQEGLVKLSEFDAHTIATGARGYIWSMLRNHLNNVYRQECRAHVIGGRPSGGSHRGRRRTAPSHLASRRTQRHFDTGPQHDWAAPIDRDEDTELWTVR